MWNGLSDLDLHAKIALVGGGQEHIFFRNQRGTGGALDVDANADESKATAAPVENIYWKEPPMGEYIISVQNYAARDGSGKVPFRVQLKFPESSLDYEGELSQKQVVPCFKFTVGEGGQVSMGSLAASTTKTKNIDQHSAAARTSRMKRTHRSPSAMKTKKSKGKASKIAKGKFSKSKVFKGKFEKTSGGLTKSALMLNASGKVVSKKKHSLGKNAYSNIRGWTNAYMKARAELGVCGFTLLHKGSSIYEKTREIYQR